MKRPRNPQKFNVDALMGIAGTVQQAVSPTTGTVKLSNGQTWTARTSTARQIPSGALIYVQQVSGAAVYIIDQPIPPTNPGKTSLPGTIVMWILAIAILLFVIVTLAKAITIVRPSDALEYHRAAR